MWKLTIPHDPLITGFSGTGAVDVNRWQPLAFALNASVHDAACAAWSLKRYYDGTRPIEAIRYMGQYGQSPTPAALPIIPSVFPSFLTSVTYTQSELRCETTRGLYYKLQSTTDLTQPFVDDPAGFVQCLDSPILRTCTHLQAEEILPLHPSHFTLALM